MLFKTLIAIIFSTGIGFGLARTLNDKTNESRNRNGEPCDWFIDLLQKRRLNRQATQVPTLLADVTEEPKEYEKFNYAAPYDFAGDHRSENEQAQLIGCSFTATTTQKPADSNEPCGTPLTTQKPEPVTPCLKPLPTTSKPASSNKLCPLPSTSTTSTTTTEEPCEEKRAVAAEERKDSLFVKRKEATFRQRLAQRLSLLEAGRKWQKEQTKKLRKRKRRVKRTRRALRKKIKKCKTAKCDGSSGDCFKAKENPATERILLEANLHVGPGFQELLLDMLSPGDKTIKIAEDEETDQLPQMSWEVLQERRK